MNTLNRILLVDDSPRDREMALEALEKTGAFQEVLSRQEEAQEDGTLRSIIQGYYRVTEAPPHQAAAEAPAAPPAEPAATARAEDRR